MNLPNPKELHNRYNMGEPFPNMTFVKVFDIEDLLQAESEFFDASSSRWKTKTKWSEKHYRYNGPQLPGACEFLINSLSNNDFLAWLSKLTGYRNLVADPYKTGAGMYMVGRDGHSDIRTGFIWNKKIKANKRVNLVLHLNSDWDEQWGGQLELWSKDGKDCVRRIQPHIGTMTIFDSSLTSFNGNPKPIKCPKKRFQKSIKLFYYQLGEVDIEFCNKATRKEQ